MDQGFRWALVRRQVRAPFFVRDDRRADHRSAVHPGFRLLFRVIEENTLKRCPDLLVECIAVGNGRPSPALLIELGPGAATFGDADSVKREVYRRIRHFQSRRLAHERIGSVGSIVIVQGSAWSRTPAGNVRRVDVEQKFQRELDRAHAAASAR